ncbi:flagellin N-terminal helical domain-containing protein [Modestobacter italicus]|uniref:flagellin N-terminal helical domain-containing protein n=1 Tax=Modestobacter italicus (strain DSM 44449 / CECT 9708 / BC 501) TaxID=2732864 RepID=UPI0027E0218A|nr:flagellin [Modestobacter italicus]
MGLGVSTNVAALSASRSLSTADHAMRTSLERLSSGYRINRAADDAAGLAISEGLRAQLGGMTQAVRNTRDGISVVQTAEGALAQTTAVLQRMRDLVVQAANDGAVDAGAKAHVQAEITQLKAELTRIAGATAFNGTRLLDGGYTGRFQVGADVGDTIDVSISGALGAVGLGVNAIDVTRDASSVHGSAARGVGQPLGGAVSFIGATVSPVGVGQLTGVLTVGGVSLDLGAVGYVPAPGVIDNASAITQLNAAALAAGFTWFQGSGADVFIDDGDDLIFRSPTPALTDTASDLPPITAAFTQPTPALSLPVWTSAPTAAPPPEAGTLLFTRTTPADLLALRGTVTANGHTLDLGRVAYSGAGNQALAELNAAAKAAGITTEDAAFTLTSVGSGSPDDGPAVLFTGPVPAVDATSAEVAAATPVYRPGPSLIAVVDAAISVVSTQRAELGAAQNRFEHTLARLGVSIENTAAAESRIRDTDMAQETVALTRSQVVVQAGTAMLAQANQSPRAVLTLLQA